ncbi:hypothetical protein ACSW9V_15105 (plasmid) [Clostridium perfringens]|uniref:hypothetical protein n=1 Tax=Clostridium perfringens TaxID=1502 RepID=UPI000B37556E|nr:hypothetical protein [Clostridium perfringens]EGT0690805.1 hypothetical protein [Clostridium perfringens]EGT0693584.1 hypothetical protein [Clostridium perfringens]EGT0696541.1 hypothetical protein [Clostridium perfringens]MDU3376210.1 hypothetical protein [Clostridium perfringens]MDU3534166.1 hypothetical protein [Clostridium perfringens]
MENRLICPKCGNKSKFYRNISVAAKLRVNKYGEDLTQVYDVNKNNEDGYFENIYCCVCDELVLEE